MGGHDKLFRLDRQATLICTLLRGFGGRRAEHLIRNLNLSFLHSFYYAALEFASDTTARPITYYEFGVGGGETLQNYIEALKAFVKDHGRTFKDHKIVLFDSFKGLPSKRGYEDDHVTWHEGKFSHSTEEIKALLAKRGLNPNSDDIRFIEGYYADSLSENLRNSLTASPPDLVTIDCDYYSSTKLVLDWLRPILRNGCLFYFDDVWAFCGNPKRGELKAINEFNELGEGTLTVFPLIPTTQDRCYLYSV